MKTLQQVQEQLYNNKIKTIKMAKYGLGIDKSVALCYDIHKYISQIFKS
jgi:hypothetical protein